MKRQIAAIVLIVLTSGCSTTYDWSIPHRVKPPTNYGDSIHPVRVRCPGYVTMEAR